MSRLKVIVNLDLKFNVYNNYKMRQTIYRYKANHDDYNAIMAAAIADRLAEAFAEYLHHIVRTNLWGYSNDEDLSATGKKSKNHSKGSLHFKNYEILLIWNCHCIHTLNITFRYAENKL